VTRPRPVRVRAPAKINLHLAVGDLRPDGYHDLTTVFHAISLYDEVIAFAAADGAGCTLTVTGEGSDGLPTDERNLAVRAALLLAESTGVEPDVSLHIEKGIPVAAGLAGGSADAAAALIACDALWGTGLPRAELIELAGELGSDVPFAVQGGTALGTGRGEQLSPVLAAGRWHWVIAIADGGLSTPVVYGELDRLRAGRAPAIGRAHLGSPDALVAALRSQEPTRLGGVLLNDLQPAAVSLRPALRRTLRAGAEEGALGAVVSGSGPTSVFLATDADHAVRLAAALAGHGVSRSVRTAYGPVHGARVMPG
jgi:4-diphosphocytidyl-2-C-methyl-D-erythritol kinase